MKFPEPPSWPTLRWINLAVVLLCTTTALLAETKWIIMADMAMAGSALASWVWIGRIIELNKILAIGYDLLTQQTAVIRELRQNSEATP